METVAWWLGDNKQLPLAIFFLLIEFKVYKITISNNNIMHICIGEYIDNYWKLLGSILDII